MKHKVVSKFTDNETGRFYPINSFYEGEDAERVLFLHKEGLIEPDKKFEGGTDADSEKRSKSNVKKAGAKKKKDDEKEPEPKKDVNGDE